MPVLLLLVCLLSMRIQFVLFSACFRLFVILLLHIQLLLRVAALTNDILVHIADAWQNPPSVMTRVF